MPSSSSRVLHRMPTLSGEEKKVRRTLTLSPVSQKYVSSNICPYHWLKILHAFQGSRHLGVTLHALRSSSRCKRSRHNNLISVVCNHTTPHLRCLRKSIIRPLNCNKSIHQAVVVGFVRFNGRRLQPFPETQLASDIFPQGTFGETILAGTGTRGWKHHYSSGTDILA